MKLSNGERLIMLMLCEIYETLKVDGDFDPKFIRDALDSGHDWAIDWKYSGIFDEPVTDDVVEETSQLLNMWWIIESSFASLSPEDKARVKERTGMADDPKFDGFDLNNHPKHYSVADFLINKLDRFKDFADRNLNSHSMASLQVARRMFVPFDRMMRHGNFRGHFNPDQLIEILRERIHPSRRADPDETIN